MIECTFLVSSNTCCSIKKRNFYKETKTKVSSLTRQLFVVHYNQMILNDDIDASENLLDDSRNSDDTLKYYRE